MRSHMEGNCRHAREGGGRGRERERKYTGITTVCEYHIGNSGFAGYVNKPDCYGQRVVL